MNGLASNFSDFLATRFWSELAPGLHLVDPDFIRAQQCFTIDEATGELGRKLMLREGYIQLDPMNWSLPIEAMTSTVTRLDSLSLPLPFAFVYDEFWLLFYRLNNVIGSLIGEDFRRLPDFWVWRVDPNRSDSGWRPHRDKGYWALFDDRRPKAVTAWIPLVDSTPLNGCMYIVPADRDPTYGTPEDDSWRFSYPDIRALPAPAGSALLWNQAVLHWGSHASEREVAARISCALEFQGGSVAPFNEPLTNPYEFPDFEFRVALIAKQILQYQHMYPLSADVADGATRLVERWNLRAADRPA